MLAMRPSCLSLLSAGIICVHYFAIISDNFLMLKVFKYSALLPSNIDLKHTILPLLFIFQL